MTARSFGIEEEFMLVDPESLVPLPLAAAAIADLRAHPHPGALTAEFQPAQLEYATGICHTGAQAHAELLALRATLATWAHSHDLMVWCCGTPLHLPAATGVTDHPRYRRIAEGVGMIADDHLINGLHVHVGVADIAEAVRVQNGLRAWLPLLRALGANSPYWRGTDTGHASWRAVLLRRWSTQGAPPYLSGPEAAAALTRRLQPLGPTREYGSANWDVRISAHLPTVEVRVCDAQLDADSATCLALIVRALADATLRREPRGARIGAELLGVELWHAGRHGLQSGGYDPVSDDHVAATEALAHLCDAVAESPDAARIAAFCDRALAGGTGAERQRSAHARGHAAFVALTTL